LYQIVNGCYAHSVIPALAFRLTTVIASSGEVRFANQLTQQSDDCGLTLNIWQQVINL